MRVLATKSDAEREDDEASRLVREAPKAKPPRRDRRRERMDTERDPDTAGDPDLKGKDTSLNYKSIGGSTVERLALRFAVALTARKNPPRGSKRKNKIPARSKETGDKVFISPETLRSEPGKYEKWRPREEDEDYSPFDAVKDVQNSPPDEATPKPEKQAKPKKKTKGKPPLATEFEPQVVKLTDEPSEDDHEYEEIDLDEDENDKPKAEGEGEPKAEGGKKGKPKKPKAKPKSKGDDGKGEGKGDEKPEKPEAKKPAPEPTVADRLGIKPPQQREASAEERAEAALVLADTLPPELAARLIAKGIHPDDAKTVVSSYRAANARPVGNPGEFAAKAAKVYQTNPDKVEPPKTWRTAEGKKVPFEDLAPDEQASAYRQHQMQVVAVSLAAQGQLEQKLTFGGVMPADIAKVVTASMLGGGKEGDPRKVFEAVTGTAGFSRIAEGTAKQMLAAVKGNDTAHALVQAFLEANDYKKAKDLYLGKGTFSERDDPKSIADGLRSARDFFKVRGSAYGGDAHEGAKRFETKVLAKLREIEPKKYQEVRRALDEEDARVYEASLKAYRKARADYDRQKKVYDGLPNARRGDEPTAPVAPIEPANYSNAKKPDQLKGEGRELWDDLFDRAGVKKTGAVVASKYLISSYLNRIAMDRTSDDRSKRALYHGVSPGAGYVREPYPAPTQVPSRGLAEADFEKILASAQQWLGSTVLTQGMTGLDADQKSRFALDLALSDGAYNLDATVYESVLARMLGTVDPGSVLKTAAALETQIFRKFPPDSKSKSGGRLNVMLTGSAAKALKKPSYTTVALSDLSAADLQKLAEAMNVKMASEHSSSSFASAGEATTSTTSNGRPITETVNMLRLSSEQKTSANQSLATIDKTAQLIQDNYKAWGIPFKIAKEMVNRLDKTADAVESLVYGERSLQNRQAEVAVQSEDFVKEALTEGLISRGEFAKAAKVIQRDSDESYMETFGNPHKPIETDADEPYMSAYGDDQSSAVNDGEDSTGRDLAP